MTAFLTLLELVAGLVIYPGGLTLAVCAGGVLGVSRRSAPGARRPRLPHRPGDAAPARLTGVGFVLAGLAVVALPWPDNPLAAVPGASAVALGSLGVPITAASLWAADSLTEPPRAAVAALTHAAWAVALVGLGVWAGSASWAVLLAAPGSAPAAVRVAIGVGAAAVLPRMAPGTVRDGWLWAGRWAAHSAVCTALWVPALGRLPPVVAVVAWLGVAAGIAAGHRVAALLRGSRSGAEEP